MRIFKYLIILGVITFLSFQKFEKNIDVIKLSYRNSLRIPFNKVDISIYRKDKQKAVVKVNCKPLENNAEWNYSKIDTSFVIDIKSFETIALSELYLKKIDFEKAYVDGFDGSNCMLEFGANKYDYWSPEYETSERGLEDFMVITEQILKIAHLRKEDIFEN